MAIPLPVLTRAFFSSPFGLLEIVKVVISRFCDALKISNNLSVSIVPISVSIFFLA